MIYFTSDLHFCHDREFIYKPRGFTCINEMNSAIVENWNRTVNMDDDVYLLGDVMLINNDEGLNLLKDLKGHIHIIIGNHDTNERVDAYKRCWNVEEVTYATVIKHGKYRFYLSHYPTFTGNLEKDSLKHILINMYGHTHQSTNFYNDIPFMYHVGVNSHNCTPVSVEQAIEDMQNKFVEYKKMR